MYPLLPDWIRWPWVVIYAVILALHVGHAVRLGRHYRAWHTTHIAMALGMVYMYLPPRLHAIPSVVWIAFYGAVVLVLGGWIAGMLASGHALNLLWLVSLFDNATMMYMFSFPSRAIALLSYVLVVYFAQEMLAWATGQLNEKSGRRKLLPLTLGGRRGSARQRQRPKSLADRGLPILAISLTVMAAGMGYMFLAMQLGL